MSLPDDPATGGPRLDAHHFARIVAARTVAGDDPAIEPMVRRMGHYPGEYGLSDFLMMPGWPRFFDRFRKSRAEAKSTHGGPAQLYEYRTRGSRNAYTMSTTRFIPMMNPAKRTTVPRTRV